MSMCIFCTYQKRKPLGAGIPGGFFIGINQQGGLWETF